jgi:hypothetical protein
LRRGAYYEKILVIVGAAEVVAHAFRWVCAHAAASGWMIQVVAFVSPKNFADIVARHPLENIRDMLLRRRIANLARGVAAMRDLRHRIAPFIFHGRIQSQLAIF